MGTTARGWPYPEDTDPVAQGAQAIKAIAQKADASVPRMAAGTVSVAINNAVNGSAVVTFPAGRFTAAPNAQATVQSTGSYHFATVWNVTAASMSVGARQYAGTVGTGTLPVGWQATENI